MNLCAPNLPKILVSLYETQPTTFRDYTAILSAVRIGTASSGTTTSYSGYSPNNSDGSSNAGAAFLIATPMIAYGVGKLLHYSNVHLNQVLTAYGNGQPLPRSLRRKLKPHFFQAPIVEYKKVKYKPAN